MTKNFRLGLIIFTLIIGGIFLLGGRLTKHEKCTNVKIYFVKDGVVAPYIVEEGGYTDYDFFVELLDQYYSNNERLDIDTTPKRMKIDE